MSTILALLALAGLLAVGMTVALPAITENRISAMNYLHHFYAAPDATTLQTLGTWVDMQDFKCVMGSYLKTTGTGLLSTFQLVASNLNTGSGTIIAINTDAWPVLQPDAAGNQVFLETTAQEVAAFGALNSVALRYVTVQYQQATAGDTGVVSLLATEPTFAYPGLTSDASS